MFNRKMAWFGLCAALAAVGCSDDDAGDDGSGGSSSAGTTSGGSSSAGTTSAGSSSGGSSTGGVGGSSAGNGGAGGASAAGNGGAAGASAGSGGTSGGAGGAAPQCPSARDELLGPIDQVSGGAISVLSTADGVSTVYIDASAGGFQDQANNPAIYLDLAALARVDITDVAAFTSSDWDLTFKRDLIRSNGGDSGPGSAEVAELSKAFDDVTSADASGANFEVDDYIDNLCIPRTDPTGKPLTPFSNWYEYDQQSMTLAPAALTYLIRAANGTDLYKLEILDYYSNPDGQTGQTSGRYRVRVGGL